MEKSANPLSDNVTDPSLTEALSLLAHCKTCASTCCRGKYVIPSNDERDRIVQAGYPDHFEKVILPESDFYVLNFSYGTCGYAKDDGSCSIQEIKPTVCKTYPAIYYFNENGTGGIMGKDTSCPAAPVVSKDFLENARPLIEEYRAKMPYALRTRISQAYRDAFKKKKDLENNGT